VLETLPKIRYGAKFEGQKKMHNSMTGKDLYQHGLTMVIAPVADGVAVEMMAKTSIEKACLSEAQWYFMQVHNTPLLLEPLVSILERSALAPKLFQEVLQGTFVPLDTCNSYVKKFLQACKLPTGLTTILPQEINSYIYAGTTQGNDFFFSIWHPLWPIIWLEPMTRAL